MSGYVGQFLGDKDFERCSVDGTDIFTEELRRQCLAARDDPEKLTPVLIDRLQGLSSQDLPSHQAQYWHQALGLPPLTSGVDIFVNVVEPLGATNTPIQSLAKIALQ